MRLTQKIVFGVLLLLIAIVAMCTYYWDKILVFVESPQSFFNLVLDASQLGKLTFVSFLMAVSLSVIAVLMDLMILGWSNSGLRRLLINPSGSARNDLWCYFLSITKIYEVLYFVLTLGIFYFITSIIVHTLDFNLGAYIGSKYLQFLFIFVITDFKMYLGHRFMHKRPFWELHAYHHSAEEFNLITTSRGHLLEAAIYYTITGLFFAVFGASILDIAFVFFIREVYQYLLHSDVNWTLGWFGKWVIVSPAAHRLHHSIDEKDYNKNYGTFLVIWDRIFGSFAAPEGNYEIGIIENPYNEVNFFKGQWLGFKRFFGFDKIKTK